MHAFKVASSLLASSLAAWRGTKTRPGVRQPKQLLELFEFEACPYCRLVREALTELDIDVLIKPAPRGGTRFRPWVVKHGGKAQFPYLVDPNTGKALYESADIIDYLYQTYAGRKPPTAWLHGLRVPGSQLATAARGMRGLNARASKPAEQPLELYSFESRNCGKTWARRSFGPRCFPTPRSRAATASHCSSVPAKCRCPT